MLVMSLGIWLLHSCPEFKVWNFLVSLALNRLPRATPQDSPWSLRARASRLYLPFAVIVGPARLQKILWVKNL